MNVVALQAILHQVRMLSFEHTMWLSTSWGIN